MPGDADPGVRADALYSAASLAKAARRPGACAVLAEESLTRARQGDRVRAARALNVLAIAPEFSGDFARAAACMPSVASSTGRPREPEVAGVANVATCHLGDAHLWRGDPQTAARLAEEALAWWRSGWSFVGDGWKTADPGGRRQCHGQSGARGPAVRRSAVIALEPGGLVRRGWRHRRHRRGRGLEGAADRAVRLLGARERAA